jgi:DNA-binding IclR family transcriptional regulator
MTATRPAPGPATGLPTPSSARRTGPEGFAAQAASGGPAIPGGATESDSAYPTTSGGISFGGVGLDRPVGALDRGLAILRYLAAAGEAPTAKVATAMALSRSTTYRLMDRLHQWGLVEANTATGHWRLGPEAARLALAALQSTQIVHAGPELLRLLAEQTCETVGLAMVNMHEMIFIYRERSRYPRSISSPATSRRPMHCTAVGKAYLAALPAAERRSLLRTTALTRYTASTITSPQRLDQELQDIQRRGWAEDRGEFSERITCCGAAVIDPAGHPVAAISVAGPSDRMQPALGRIGPMVASTAQAISRRLGCPLSSTTRWPSGTD